MSNTDKERMLDLLAGKAVDGLTEDELLELKELERKFPELADDESFELAAASIGLTNLVIDEPLPENLRAKLLADADVFFAAAANETKQNVLSFEPRTKEFADAKRLESNSSYAPKFSFANWFGWAVAAAACVALAVNLWTTRVQPPPQIVQIPETTATPKPTLSPAQEREQLLASAKDVVQTTWTEANPKAPKNIAGDIVWSSAEQKGYLRFRGLPVNDPNKETYQLWIFDETQDAKTPIDGGVFDVDKNGEVIIPINAKLQVKKPKMFAVTVEKPGGVVVSKQEKLMAIAKI